MNAGVPGAFIEGAGAEELAYRRGAVSRVVGVVSDAVSQSPHRRPATYMTADVQSPQTILRPSLGIADAHVPVTAVLPGRTPPGLIQGVG